MTRNEFEKKIESKISEMDYEIIEKVYLYYPGIDNAEGKVQVADLYSQFGMNIFHDMHKRAIDMERIEKIEIINYHNYTDERFGLATP
ncbi:hypothetical protein LCGC14_2378570 [marine sediment metagenome]|uniref:Uncharacterized protein n=1 Tax=marine sediment metagenome TaxID=412755 RepID=A0A0F9C1L6_9ZZZZ